MNEPGSEPDDDRALEAPPSEASPPGEPGREASHSGPEAPPSGAEGPRSHSKEPRSASEGKETDPEGRNPVSEREERQLRKLERALPPVDRVATHRISVLCNPESGEVRRRIGPIRRAGKELAGRAYREVEDGPRIMQEVEAALDEGCDVLTLVGGDGTIQAALTALDRLRPEGVWPALAVVPGGTANMTARDLGAVGPPVERLEALREWRDAGTPRRAVVRRPILRIGRPGEEPLSGMFFGAGVVAAGVEYFQERLDGIKTTGERVSALAVGRVLLDLAFGGEAGKAAARPITVSVDGRPRARFRGLLCLVSTLHRLLLNTRPYWGDGEGPLHVTLVEEEARALWRSLPRLVTGRAGSILTPDRGYHSRDACRVEIEMEGPFVLDGELYEAPAAREKLTLSSPRAPAWVVP